MTAQRPAPPLPRRDLDVAQLLADVETTLAEAIGPALDAPAFDALAAELTSLLLAAA